MTKPKATDERQYLVTKPSGLTTGTGFYPTGAMVPASALADSTRRLIRTGQIVDLGDTSATPTKRAPKPEPQLPQKATPDDPVTEAIQRSELPTLAEDHSASGVVAQSIPVVLRFIAAYPARAGEIVAAERKRPKPRQAVIKAALAAGGATRKS